MEIQKIKKILECFYVTSNPAQMWSYCSARLAGDMLHVWFTCSLFFPGEHGEKITTALEVCTKEK